MSARIETFTQDNKPTGAITVETLSGDAIGIGFVRYGQPAQAIRLSRELAERLAYALALELRGDA